MDNKMFFFDLSFYVGVCIGVTSRIIMLNTDQKQYPSHPNILVTQLVLAFVASALGALLVPAIIERSYTSITFLSLAAEQFRQVRAIRRNTLQNIESSQLVKRGESLIEEIAKAYEVRNYMCIITSFFTVAIDTILREDFGMNNILSLVIAGATNLILAFLIKKLLTRKKVGDIADIVQVPISFVDTSILKVGDLKGITNIGLLEDRELYLQKAVGIEIIPKNKNYENASIIYNSGQRQAILYNIYSKLGRYGDIDEPQYTPIPRKFAERESILFAYIPLVGDAQDVINAVKNCPVIESTKGKNLALKNIKIGSIG
ncbi:MAG: YIEGIA family protein [Clostridioides sp.]|jgi:hypothetical protein|nr:YIEGIA family protein [Clostridioides sp.]